VLVLVVLLQGGGGAAAASSPATAAPPAAAAAAAGDDDEEEEDQAALQFPPYQLKLARDNGDTKAMPWCGSYFHPNVFHYTFVLDWDVQHSRQVSQERYMAAAAATVAAAAAQGGSSSCTLPPATCSRQEQQQEEQQQEEQPTLQERQQPPAADDVQHRRAHLGQQQQQQQHCWKPDPSSVGIDGKLVSEKQQQQQDLISICGDYVLSALYQPEYDVSIVPIRSARSDPRGKSVALECCVQAFLQPEQLSEADEWYCPKCQKHVQVGWAEGAGGGGRGEGQGGKKNEQSVIRRTSRVVPSGASWTTRLTDDMT
jgi:hypothetical protein